MRGSLGRDPGLMWQLLPGRHIALARLALNLLPLLLPALLLAWLAEVAELAVDAALATLRLHEGAGLAAACEVACRAGTRQRHHRRAKEARQRLRWRQAPKGRRLTHAAEAACHVLGRGSGTGRRGAGQRGRGRRLQERVDRAALRPVVAIVLDGCGLHQQFAWLVRPGLLTLTSLQWQLRRGGTRGDSRLEARRAGDIRRACGGSPRRRWALGHRGRGHGALGCGVPGGWCSCRSRSQGRREGWREEDIRVPASAVAGHGARGGRAPCSRAPAGGDVPAGREGGVAAATARAPANHRGHAEARRRRAEDRRREAAGRQGRRCGQAVGRSTHHLVVEELLCRRPAL
mmetsp:Transcript_77606/g.199824  ORF Transcript_77606/g.199824 Transcript_77606/m.199824 type:complete len:346 (-) Transcript_77606:136-1173(-)